MNLNLYLPNKYETVEAKVPSGVMKFEILEITL